MTHAGLRKNEIARLSLDCAQAQTQDVVEEGHTVPAGTLCYLRAPKQDLQGLCEARGRSGQGQDRCLVTTAAY